ncbi:LexA family transcriptional regulator [Bacteroides neonati]|uniref:LexA family transcriptional regulator n=1 Tax=Bacteroides neonati TaxID=1347393 RepID=UPI0004B6F10F|nr:XRE family transcriptional regulator [Bacteroides neonati]
MTINQRIESIIYESGESLNGFAECIGVKQQTLYNYIAKNREPSYSVIEKIAKLCTDINIEWLITGEGSMFKSEEPSPIVSYSAGRPYYNVDFIGGFDLILNDQSINPEYNIDFPPYNKDGVMWCNLTGHSMEPEINHGDMMAIKKVNESNINYLPFGEVYAIVTDDYRTVKRMSKSEKEGFIKLIPSNPSPEYAAQDIPISMIKAIFQVLVNVKRF